MTYLDTNVFVYALSKNVDDLSQKEKALGYLREAIKENRLVVSEIVLYEFAFVSKKLAEEPKSIEDNLEFLADFVERLREDIFSKVLKFMSEHNFYRHSFDVYHLLFSENIDCKRFITFDKGFNKLQKHTDIKIEIL
jgi:predicted nucleic acid-binding protein